MTENSNNFQVDGILSFIKGCVAFSFDQRPGPGSLYSALSLIYNSRLNLNYSVLSQQSNNPAAYTKLICFLPWIAEQYGLEYNDPGETDKACVEGNGKIEDVTEVENRECSKILIHIALPISGSLVCTRKETVYVFMRQHKLQ